MVGGSLPGTCIANSKGGNAICIQASAGETDGSLRSNSIIMRAVSASKYSSAIAGGDAQFPVNFEGLADFQKQNLPTKFSIYV